ncbi:hypothetical protein K501DRAFT_241517 [Backusella circina FSU 941]|nr:hypothetical protein K501DRAFT_241517 [Backusella circina FSU 941]
MCLDTVPSNVFNDVSKQWVSCPSSFQTTALKRKRHTDRSFDITFHCQDTSNTTCHKAKQAFERVGDMISQMILFKQPIKVNATLASFCKLDNQRCDEKMITLGGSCPSRSIPLLNKDGVFRLHPQALVKQFELEERPLFAPFDIISVFNVDAPFWFEHEFMHGLGFYSGWNQYLSNQDSITPDPSPFLTNQWIQTLSPGSNAIHPAPFIESALDRLIHILPLNMSLSDLTHQMNAIGGDMTSPAFKSITDRFKKIATTPFTMGIKIGDNVLLILETGLSPFKSGSSISHVAFQKYNEHPEFLMRYKQDRGRTLADVQGSGHHAMGPSLLSVFEALGYATKQHPEAIPPLFIVTREWSPSFVHAGRANMLSPVVPFALLLLWCGLIF